MKIKLQRGQWGYNRPLVDDPAVVEQIFSREVTVRETSSEKVKPGNLWVSFRLPHPFDFHPKGLCEVKAGPALIEYISKNSIYWVEGMTDFDQEHYLSLTYRPEGNYLLTLVHQQIIGSHFLVKIPAQVIHGIFPERHL